MIKQETLEAASRIKLVEHDGENLRVHFKSGSIYDYEDVSDELFDNLVKSESPGHVLLSRIRPDRKAIPVTPGTPFPRVS